MPPYDEVPDAAQGAADPQLDPSAARPDPSVTGPGAHRAGRRIAPKLLSKVLALALVVAAVLAAGAVAYVWGDDAQRGAAAPTRTDRPRETSNAVVRKPGVADLFERRAAAVRDHDKAAFLAQIDPTAEAFRARQSALFDRLMAVPLATWSYDLAGDGPALPDDRAVSLPKGSAIARVLLDYTFSGSTSEVERDQYFTVVPRGGSWLLAGDDDAAAKGVSSDKDIWDLGPVRAVRGGSSLVLGDASKTELQRLAVEADRGVSDVAEVWRRQWSRRPVVIFPKSQQDMATLIGSDGKGLSQIAAVTTGSFDSGLSRGDRVVVNPGAWRTLGSLGRRVVLAHEITHLATRAITNDAVPIWLSEGFADYVAYQAVDVPTNVVADDIFKDVRAGKGPTDLPGDGEFDASQGDIASAYEGAWLACRLIAERFGQQKLIGLYVNIADSSASAPDEVKATLGITEGQLVKQWRRYLAARAGA